MFEEGLGSFQRDIFARTTVLAVGVCPCFYGFLIKKIDTLVYILYLPYKMEFSNGRRPG